MPPHSTGEPVVGGTAKPPADYTLTDEESRAIFNEQIRPTEFQDLEQYSRKSNGNGDSVRPICILIGGQTGAGKTRTAPQLANALTSLGRRFPHFIADTYKTYHPAYTKLIAEKPALASRATGNDARKWLAMACETAIELRLDCLVESACRNPTDFTSIAEAFHKAGYRVLVVLMAVHQSQSRLGTLVRYYRDLPEARSRGLPLRLTPRIVHDESYDGLVKVASFLDDSEAAEKVVVVRRDNLVGYSNKRKADGIWENPPDAREALQRERNRPNVEAETAVFAQDLQSLLKEQPERADELKEIGDLQRSIQEQELSQLGNFPELRPLDCAVFLSSET